MTTSRGIDDPGLDAWPPLDAERTSPTYATLHLWAQVVGKVALARAPRLNHSWGAALQPTPRGLSTIVLPYGDRTFTIEFDFIDHRLVVRTSNGDMRWLPLQPQTVADFYAGVMGLLDDMSLPVTIWPVTVEMPEAVRLDSDRDHHAYDGAAATRLWRVVSAIARELIAARTGFVGKTSPAHFFWGGFDLALTRFSGRLAPPREGPEFMREAYSHEVISHGFWLGSGPVLEPAFYAYAVPEPAGFKETAVAPEGAYYERELGEFVLPYEAVRAAPSPAAAIRAFVDSTYAAGAELAKWDRATLER